MGFNDLKTKFPDIAKEADGWDPSTVITGSHKKFPWKCSTCNYKWKTGIDQRTGKDKTGCSVCAQSGYNPEKPAWFYLMKRENEQQFGITNNLEERINVHSRTGWQLIRETGPYDGYEVQETEKKLKKWLKEKIGLVPNKQENWYTSKMEVHSLAELKERSGIETSIF